MAKSHEMHIIDDAFAAIAIFQILLVGLYCLPLFLPDRVSIMRQFVHTSVMKLASWENLFIEPVHRWRAGRNFRCILHYIKPFYGRFDLFHNWLLAWLILISIFDAFTEWPLMSECNKFLLAICLSLQLIRLTIIYYKSIAVSNCSRSLRTNPILSIVCHGNFSSLPAEQKQRLIDNGRALMDRSSPTELEGVLKALGKDAESATVVAIVFAVVAEAKQMPELRLKGRSDLVGNLNTNDLVIENVPRFWTAKLLAEKLVEINPDLDIRSVICVCPRQEQRQVYRCEPHRYSPSVHGSIRTA